MKEKHSRNVCINPLYQLGCFIVAWNRIPSLNSFELYTKDILTLITECSEVDGLQLQQLGYIIKDPFFFLILYCVLYGPCNPHSHRILLVTVWVIVNIQIECFSPNITKQKTWTSPWLGCLRNLPSLEPLCPGKYVDFLKS